MALADEGGGDPAEAQQQGGRAGLRHGRKRERDGERSAAEEKTGGRTDGKPDLVAWGQGEAAGDRGVHAGVRKINHGRGGVAVEDDGGVGPADVADEEPGVERILARRRGGEGEDSEFSGRAGVQNEIAGSGAADERAGELENGRCAE